MTVNQQLTEAGGVNKSAHLSRTSIRRIASQYRGDLPAFTFVGTLFLIKALLADRHSYWMDELSSVWITGVGQETFREAMSWFVRDGNHPPLYELILYAWMMVFGDSEISTRNLSNLFVAAGSIVLYFVLRVGFSRLVAFSGLTLFSLSSLAVEYSLETRSYGLFILVVVVSGFILAKWVAAKIADEKSAKSDTLLGWLLFLANTTVLLTHYFGLFFLAAQAVFVLIFVSRTSKTPIRDAVNKIFAWYVLPIAVFLIVWGWVFIPTFFSSGVRHSIDGPASLPPWDLYLTATVNPTISAALLGLVLSLIALSSFAISLWKVVKPQSTATPAADWLTVLLGVWLFLPFVLVFVAFSLIGAEQYQARYFIFSLPALFGLLAISLAGFSHLATKRLSQPHVSIWLTTALTTALTLSLLPSTHEDLASGKGDYRDVAEEIIYFVNENPGYDYVVFETARGKQSMLDYYFERRNTDIRSRGNFPLFEENDNDFDIIRKDLGGFRQAERIIVAYPSDPFRIFPNLQTQLEEDFEVVFVRETPRQTGFIVYEVPGLTSAE